MNTAVDCINCFVRQAIEAVCFCTADKARQAEIINNLFAELGYTCWLKSPANVAQCLHRLIREKTGNLDPYHALKKRMNTLAIELLPELLKETRSDKNPRIAITRLALAGNLIDAGAKTGLCEEDVQSALRCACKEQVVGSADNLFEEVNKAGRILFLADNAGEIVFDKALIETLPIRKISVGVRGFPVLNDATIEDAEMAGLTEIVPVIPNGSDAPGTIIDDCSPQFRIMFDASDLVIAKGQGNYESLHFTDKHIFFLLRVKCSRVATDLGSPIGSMVIYERNRTSGNTKPSENRR